MNWSGSNRRIVGLTLSVLAPILVVALSATTASAGEYEVRPCTFDFTVAEDPAGSTGFHVGRECATIFLEAKGPSVTGGERWTLNAPADTTIHTLTVERQFGLTPTSIWNDDFEFQLGSGAQVLETVGPSNHPAAGKASFTVDSTSVFGRLSCRLSVCQGGPVSIDSFVRAENFSLVLRDDVLPTATIDGSIGHGRIGGVRTVSYLAADRGGGVARVQPIVDGAPQAAVTSEPCNDTRLVPCALTLGGSFRLDTTKLQDGPHRVEVAVTDAAGGVGSSAPVTIEVDNSSHSGTGSGAGKPSLSNVSLSRRRFRVGAARGARSRRSGGGTVLRFSGSDSGSLSVTIARVRAGKPAKPVARLSRAVAAGRGRIAFSGRFKGRALAPGRYTLLAVLHSAGGDSNQAKLSFRILPG